MTAERTLVARRRDPVPTRHGRNAAETASFRSLRLSPALLSLGAFLGTVIGVGIFGLPAVASTAGFVPLAAGFLALVPVLIVIHERLAWLALQTSERHRIPGYIGIALGSTAQRAAALVLVLALLGALLAYLLVGGEFLRLLLQPVLPVSGQWATLLYVLAGGALVLLGTRNVARTDVALMLILLVLLAVFALAALPVFRAEHLATTNWALLPGAYGILFFSLWGVDAVPEAVGLAGRNAARSRAVIVVGLAGAALVYLLFTAIVLGVTGPVSAADTLTRFLAATHPGLVLLVALFGFVTTFTSFITLGIGLQRTLVFDLRIGARVAALGIVLGPLALYVAGLQNFLAIIGVTGAVLLGLEGGFVLLAADALRHRRRPTRRAPWGTLLLLLLLAAGVLYEVIALVQGTVAASP